MLIYAIVYNIVLIIATVVENSLDHGDRAVVQYDVADFNSVKRTSTSAMFFFCFALLFPITIHLVFYVLYVTKLYIYDAVATYMRSRKARLTAQAAAAATTAAVVSQPVDAKGGKDDGLESPMLDAETTVHVQENFLVADERHRGSLSESVDKFGSETRPAWKGTEHRRSTVTGMAESDSLDAPGMTRRHSRASSGDVKSGHRTSRSGSMMGEVRTLEQFGLLAEPLFEVDDFTVIIDPE